MYGLTKLNTMGSEAYEAHFVEACVVASRLPNADRSTDPRQPRGLSPRRQHGRFARVGGQRPQARDRCRHILVEEAPERRRCHGLLWTGVGVPSTTSADDAGVMYGQPEAGLSSS